MRFSKCIKTTSLDFGQLNIHVFSLTICLFTQQVPLCDVVDPPDFEDFLLQQQYVIERDPMRHLLDFPTDDVIVARLRRHVRTIAPIVPENGLVLLTFTFFYLYEANVELSKLA